MAVALDELTLAPEQIEDNQHAFAPGVVSKGAVAFDDFQ